VAESVAETVTVSRPKSAENRSALAMMHRTSKKCGLGRNSLRPGLPDLSRAK